MAIFHFSTKTFSRSATLKNPRGQSAVAAAAYRAGARYTDTCTGQVHDYTRKSAVDETFLVCPHSTFSEPEKMWNAAEAAEKRKNSTVAREYEIALPAELSRETQKQLAREMSEYISKKYGVGIQASLHKIGTENPHVHILSTTREITPEGLGKKTRILDDRKTGAEEIKAMREHWAELCNRELARHNEPSRVDHRSNAERKIEALPSVHEGPSASALAQRGRYSERRRENARRREVNKLLKIAQREVLAADNAQIEAEHALAVHRETVRAEREAAANEATRKIFAHKSPRIALDEKISVKLSARKKTPVAQKNADAPKKQQKTAGRVMIEKELEKLKSAATRPPFSLAELSIHGEQGAAKIVDAQLDKLKSDAKKSAENRRKIYKKHPILKMLGLKNRAMKDAEKAETAAKKVYRAAKKNWSQDVRAVLSERQTANRGWQKRIKPALDKKVSEIENALASPNLYVQGALNRGDLEGAIRRRQQAEREHQEKIQREKIQNEMRKRPVQVPPARSNEREPGGPAPGL
ncbi:MobA/MobL family protein [Acetobacter pasteurianus]|uniref:MobA/MobL family protein n=1 Tax=Acetobacter pasteurianus TaxID=438 RepID=UPI003D126DB3